MERAFPQRVQDEHDVLQPGMTLRDWFAGQAIQGLMLEERMWNSPDEGMSIGEHIAINAYDLADAMIKARSK